MEAETEQKKPDALAESILRAAGLSVDDLKSVETVFRDLAASLAARLAAQTEVPVVLDFAGARTLEKSDTAGSITGSALLGTVAVPKWGSRLLLAADRAFAECATEILFGSGFVTLAEAPSRPLTSIDLSVATHVFGEVAAALDQIFASGSETLFQLGDIAETAHLPSGSPVEARMICCSLVLKAAGVSGTVDILLPRSSFRPMQDAIARLLRRPAHHLDPAWAKKMRLEVSRAHVELEAYLQQGTMTLAQIAELRPGQILQLPKDAIDHFRLRSGGQSLYKCRLGKAGTAFTVRLTEPVNEEEDLLDELAAG